MRAVQCEHAKKCPLYKLPQCRGRKSENFPESIFLVTQFFWWKKTYFRVHTDRKLYKLKVHDKTMQKSTFHGEYISPPFYKQVSPSGYALKKMFSEGNKIALFMKTIRNLSIHHVPDKSIFKTRDKFEVHLGKKSCNTII